MKYSFDNIFSIPNPDIVGEISKDPLGFQVIWSHLGQKIFNNRLTTVAYDIRNYTLNLMHYYVIRKIYYQKNSLIAEYKSKGIYNSDAEFKAGLIIYLEDLFINAAYILNKERKLSSVDAIGLLGFFNVSRKHDVEENVLIEADKKSGVLVRQISLGVNGRYKGPFISLGLVNRSYDFLNSDLWGDIEILFQKWSEASDLIKEIERVIYTELLPSGKNRSQKKPSISFNSLKENRKIQSLYLSCFGKPIINNNHIKQFWKKQLNLDKGAAGAIYDQLIENRNGEPRLILELAIKSIDSIDEKNKIIQIQDIEPFLCIMDHAFNILSYIKTRKIQQSDLSELFENIFNFNTERVTQYRNVHKRLADLIDIFETGKGDILLFCIKLNAYHKTIMNERGGTAWLEISERGDVKHYYWHNDALNKIPINNPKWIHDFYIPTVKSILYGIEGT